MTRQVDRCTAQSITEQDPGASRDLSASIAHSHTLVVANNGAPIIRENVLDASIAVMGRVEHSDTKKVRYSTLEARVKHVPEATIRKKWKKLPAANHAAAREAVLSAKDQSRTRTRKATDLASQECVQEIANK